MRQLSFVLAPVLSLSLVACGGDDDGTVTPIDAPVQNIDAAPVTCTVSTNSFGDAGALTGQAFFRASQANPALYQILALAPLEPTAPQDVLFVDLYTGYEPFGTEQAPTPVVPGTYPLTGAQTDYATCGTCVTISTNVNGQAFDDDYMVTGGSLVISAVGDAIGETLTFSLSNLQLQHVTINEQTGATTAVGDGCTTALSAATFTATVAAFPSNAIEGLRVFRSIAARDLR